MPTRSKIALEAAKWLCKQPVSSAFDRLGDCAKVTQTLEAVGMGLRPEERSRVQLLAQQIYHNEEMIGLLESDPMVGDEIERAFIRRAMPFGRRILVLSAIADELDRCLAQDAEFAAASNAIKNSGWQNREATQAFAKTRNRSRAANKNNALRPRQSAALEVAAQQDGDRFDQANLPDADENMADVAVETGGSAENDTQASVNLTSANPGLAVEAPGNRTTIAPANQILPEEVSIVLPSVTLVVTKPSETSGPDTADDTELSQDHSACNPQWKPHDGAEVRTVGLFSYYSGQGATRLDPPPGSGSLRLFRGYLWNRSARDGMWRDETRAEWRKRAEMAERSFFAAFDNKLAEKVENAIPENARGYCGPGQTMPALVELAKTLRPGGPYQVPSFLPDGEIEVFEGGERKIDMMEIAVLPERDCTDFLHMLPSEFQRSQPVARLRASTNPAFADVWQDLPIIAKGNNPVFRPSPCQSPSTRARTQHDTESGDEPEYAQAASILRKNRKARLDAKLNTAGFSGPYAMVLGGYSWLLSGANGTGKTHWLLEVAEYIDERRSVITPMRLFFFNMKAPNTKRRSCWYQKDQFDEMLDAARDSMLENEINILFVDEVTELDSSFLAKLAFFHQLVCGGDSAQSTDSAQPFYDFIRRAGGGSSVKERVWRAARAALFDLVSLLAYDGAYSAFPSPYSLVNPDARALAVGFCPDDPQTEAVGLFAAAMRNLKVGLKVTIVVDGQEAADAINALAFSDGNKPRHPKLTVLASHELRGHECDSIIVATAALDRADLPTPILLERLIVILGRARYNAEFLLPLGGVVGSAKRRFSCLVQPLLSTCVKPRKPQDTDLSVVAEALSERKFILKELDGNLICYRDPVSPVIIKFADGMSEFDALAAEHKNWSVFEADFDPTGLDREALESDQRFVTLLDDLRMGRSRRRKQLIGDQRPGTLS